MGTVNTGWYGFSNAANVDDGADAWVNPTNVLTDDSSDATCTLATSSATDYLRVYNWLGSSLVPVDATIDKLQIAFLSGATWDQAGTNIQIAYGDSGIVFSSSFSSTGTYLETNTWVSGEPSSLTNQQKLDIIHATIAAEGPGVRCSNPVGGTDVISWDYARMRVAYEGSAGGILIATG